MSIVKIKHRKVGKGISGIRPIRGPKKVKVGFPAGEADSDVISRAIWNNFGTSRGIPERPFMQNAMRDNRAGYRDGMKAGARTIIKAAASGEDPAKAMRSVLAKLGIKAQGDIQSEITSLQTPPNAASTIRQKGSSNPLIDTGEMRGAVSFKVED